jgi:hypothetical protein
MGFTKATKVEAGWWTVGPFEIVFEPQMEIAFIEGDRKFWQVTVAPGNAPAEEGAHGRFETLREAVEEINTQHAWELRVIAEKEKESK